MEAKDSFNIKFEIKYVITGREDGRWIVKAFDRNDNPLGTSITVTTPDEAWKIWLMLNGYGGYTDEETIVIIPEKAA
jgi:hypothetical protein